MFDLTNQQKSRLCNNSFLKREQSLRSQDPEVWRYINDQYYPSFRRFITNEPSEIDDFMMLSGMPGLLPETLQKSITVNGNDVIISFKVTNVEIFLFKHNPGIITLEVEILEPTLELYSSLVNGIRMYNSVIVSEQDGKEMSMLELIQDYILNRAAGAGTFDLATSKTADYRGSKLKVFQAIDLKDTPPHGLINLLFELATVSPINSTVDPDNENSHSPAYFHDVTSRALNIYNNWTALCLFDTFTMVGYHYLEKKSTLETWRMNYFRIYIYDLYFKYYLFSFNGDGLHEDRRLKKQRRDFYNFLRIYEADPISYNFLPNLIHTNIKTGLQTQTETEGLRLRIDRITSLISEDYNRMSNLILFIISIIALIPSNWGEIIGEKDPLAIHRANEITLTVKITLVVMFWLVNLIIRRTGKRPV